MGVGHWGHSVAVDLRHGVGHWGSSDGSSLHLDSVGDSLNGDWCGGVDVGDGVPGVGNGGNGSPHGGNWGDTNIGSGDQVGNSVGNGSSHNSLADGVNESILVQVLGEALKSIGAKALWGLDCVSEGRSEGADWNTRVDMGGGGSKATGKERRQDKGLHSDSLSR